MRESDRLYRLVRTLLIKEWTETDILRLLSNSPEVDVRVLIARAHNELTWTNLIANARDAMMPAIELHNQLAKGDGRCEFIN